MVTLSNKVSLAADSGRLASTEVSAKSVNSFIFLITKTTCNKLKLYKEERRTFFFNMFQIVNEHVVNVTLCEHHQAMCNPTL